MEQLNMDGEQGWPEGEVPKEIEDKPELHLAWRGLVISIGAGQMTRKQGFEMLKGWEELEHLHDVDTDGDAAA